MIIKFWIHKKINKISKRHQIGKSTTAAATPTNASLTGYGIYKKEFVFAKTPLRSTANPFTFSASKGVTSTSATKTALTTPSALKYGKEEPQQPNFFL